MCFARVHAVCALLARRVAVAEKRGDPKATMTATNQGAAFRFVRFVLFTTRVYRKPFSCALAHEPRMLVVRPAAAQLSCYTIILYYYSTVQPATFSPRPRAAQTARTRSARPASVRRGQGAAARRILGHGHVYPTTILGACLSTSRRELTAPGAHHDFLLIFLSVFVFLLCCLFS